METGADIQVENGNWAKVHNTILKKLAFIKLDGREAKCLFFLFSMTYGNREKEHAISLSLWAAGTDLDKRNVAKVIDGLIARNIIYRTGNGRGRGSITVYGFNKHFEDWDNSTEKVLPITPIKKVSPTTPLIPEKVLPITPEKVLPITPTTERREGAAAAFLPKRNASDFVKSYEEIWGMLVESHYRGEQISDWEKRVTYEGWRYALQECADTHHVGNWKYLSRILERIEKDGYLPALKNSSSVTVDFALEDVSQ